MNSMTQPSKPASQLTQQATIQATKQATTMATDSAKSSRIELRQRLLQQRRAITESDRARWDQSIRDQISAWCDTHRPTSLGIYWPIQAEPDLLTLYPALHQIGIQLSLPCAATRDQALQFLSWQPGAAMTLDQYRIPIPQQRIIVPTPQVLLIPCVGFNADRFRLGYGGGFYDRTLAVWPNCIALGIAYQQALSVFTADPHDIKMHQIITENDHIKAVI